MEKGDLIIATVLMALGILIAISSFMLGLWKMAKPGAGLMPFGLGIILSLCSIPILIRSFMNVKRAGKRKEEGVWSGVDFKKIALVLASLFSYFVLLERLGFLVTAFLTLLILFKVVGSQKWRWALIDTVLTIFFVYFLFIILLDVYIPFFPLGIR